MAADRTAGALARSLGLAEADSPALDGTAITRLTDTELALCVRETTVFSRVSPEDKLRIVAAFQDGGEVVAMLGDGVNDAAALKKAQEYVRDHKDEDGKRHWKHPYYWAAWVLWGLPD